MSLESYISRELVVPYKGRKINLDKPVDVYRCLNRRDGKWYSIRQDGLVVAHARALMLTDAKFKINDNGRKRAILSKRRNVHAYVRGTISTRGAMGIFPEQDKILAPVWYDLWNGFTLLITNPPTKISGARAVCLNHLGCSAAYTW